ncbi:MAG: G8 domain-containing protein [Isosphaeraceae bacterium]
MPMPATLMACLLTLAIEVPRADSAASGRWSDARTWVGGRIPHAGDRVRIAPGHVVVFDAVLEGPIRSLQVAGTLTFDPDRDAQLTAGLIRVQAGDDPGESGFDCDMAGHRPSPELARAALEVGTADRPIAAGRRAVIRLAPVDGLDPETCPALVCCGGRMEFHGAAVEPTWTKLAESAQAGGSAISLAEPVRGWGVGDRVLITATRTPRPRGSGPAPLVAESSQTEVRTILEVGDSGDRLKLDAPLAFAHEVRGELRGEVALLSRNVVVESADPSASRGHVMYHRDSAAAIEFAEFRHLGKVGRLGKYSLHFHRAGDTMRGTPILGASIWDSGNRWLTIHGTNGLVVRDCVGFGSVGHGFFLEDGTEVDNLLDRNLAVQARKGSPLPDQAMPFDANDGAGFWWGNCRNAFTRNVAADCDEYGFRYDMAATAGFDPAMPIRTADGVRLAVDVRTQPFLRFEGNEAHAQRRHGLNLGGPPEDGARPGVDGVGPDVRHPFAILGFKVWDSRWGLTPSAPCVLLDGCRIVDCDFGVWKPIYDRHAYRNVAIDATRWPYFGETGDRDPEAPFPAPLDPVDDRPPVTLVTHFRADGPGRLRIAGVAVDDGRVRRVRVNGIEAKELRRAAGVVDWEGRLDGLPGGTIAVRASAEDDAGNVEEAAAISARVP